MVGIKDVNDQLVSTTLKALSQLVLILGAATVVGGKRGKLFTDGRPKSQISQPLTKIKADAKEKSIRIPVKSDCEVLFTNNGLPERLSPDGGEYHSSSSTVEEGEGDTEHWSDWDLPVSREFCSTRLELQWSIHIHPRTFCFFFFLGGKKLS